MTEELKPCPFCGGKEPNPLEHAADCYCRMSYEMMLPHSEVVYPEEKLREAWNKRAERTCKLNQEGFDIAAVAVCDKCGDRFGVYAMAPEMFNYCPNCGAKVVE